LADLASGEGEDPTQEAIERIQDAEAAERSRDHEGAET
jgi:hypothetical protein